MEAKDTVMDLRGLTVGEVGVANQQAEISFKAGFKHALEGAVMEGGYESVKKVGIKEVVEWGLETCPHDLFGEGTHCYKRACDECWKDKIKECGV